LKVFYIVVVSVGISFGLLSLLYQPHSIFIPFNWSDLAIFIMATIFLIASLKYQKIFSYFLFVIGILAMLNTYFYFKQCSYIKGLELFGGFFISLAPLFVKVDKKKNAKRKLF